MFNRKPQYLVIEIEKGSKLPELTGDLKEAIKVLPQIPAFNYLLQRLKHQRAALQAHLANGLNLSEVQLRYIQAGLYWLNHLDREIKLLTQSKSAPTEATPDVTEEFEKIRQSIELI